jgi:hypothetical protein
MMAPARKYDKNSQRDHSEKDNIKIDLGNIDWEGVDWIHLTQDRDQWPTVVKTVMNLRIP